MTLPALQLSDAVGEYIAPLSSKYWAIHFTPKLQQTGVLAIFCFAHLMDQLATASAEVIADKSVWWHDELERLAQAQARHPITQSLQQEIATVSNFSDEAATLLYQHLHRHLHGALMTQQNTPIANQEEWMKYGQLRTGSLHATIGTWCGQTQAQVNSYSDWVTRFNLLTLSRFIAEHLDQRWLQLNQSTHSKPDPADLVGQLEKLLKQRPNKGCTASEVLLHHDIKWWRKDATEAAPFYSNKPLGLMGLFSSWNAARR